MILVTGINGQLGFDVIKELRLRNIECIGTTRKELDITDEKAVYDYIKKVKPEELYIVQHIQQLTEQKMKKKYAEKSM